MSILTLGSADRIHGAHSIEFLCLPGVQIYPVGLYGGVDGPVPKKSTGKEKNNNGKKETSVPSLGDTIMNQNTKASKTRKKSKRKRELKWPPAGYIIWKRSPSIHFPDLSDRSLLFTDSLQTNRLLPNEDTSDIHVHLHQPPDARSHTPACR